MTDARHRRKLAADQHYVDLAAKASSIAMAQLKDRETAEMQFYAGMGDAFVARLYGLRGENRATARSGVRARAHFLRAIKLDPNLTDAEFGLGLYNYYVDTLSAIAKLVGFFMGLQAATNAKASTNWKTTLRKAFLRPPRLGFIWHKIFTGTISSMKKRSASSVPWLKNIHLILSFNWPVATCMPNWDARSRPSLATEPPQPFAFKMPSAALVFKSS